MQMQMKVGVYAAWFLRPKHIMLVIKHTNEIHDINPHRKLPSDYREDEIINNSINGDL